MKNTKEIKEEMGKIKSQFTKLRIPRHSIDAGFRHPQNLMNKTSNPKYSKRLNSLDTTNNDLIFTTTQNPKMTKINKKFKFSKNMKNLRKSQVGVWNPQNQWINGKFGWLMDYWVLGTFGGNLPEKWTNSLRGSFRRPEVKKSKEESVFDKLVGQVRDVVYDVVSAGGLV